ncbi:MAG: hypothetical protein OXH73_17115 [Caldilineaceae bacterium]|nr:hypothetical protein [Caldilineaceae bacterium]
MAENDRFEKSLSAGWRTAANYVENENVSLEEISDKLMESLVNSLRKFDGVPGFQAIVAVLETQMGPSLLDGFCALEDIVRDRNGHRHTKIAANVAKSILAGEEKLGSKDKAHLLAENVCLALLRHCFFARVCPRLTTKARFSNHKKLHEWQIGIEHSVQPRIETVSALLVDSPDAYNLKTPRKSTKKVSTSDLLVEVLV